MAKRGIITLSRIIHLLFFSYSHSELASVHHSHLLHEDHNFNKIDKCLESTLLRDWLLILLEWMTIEWINAIMLSRSKNFWHKKETYIILSEFSLLLPKKRKKKGGGKSSNEWSENEESFSRENDFSLEVILCPIVWIVSIFPLACIITLRSVKAPPDLQLQISADPFPCIGLP